MRGERGHAAQAPQKIQRHPLGGENRPRRAFDAREDGAGREVVAVAGQRLETHGGIDQFESFAREVEAGEDARFFARGDDRAGAGFGGNRGLRCDVAGAAEILLQRRAHRAFDQQGIKHGQGHGRSRR